MSYFFYVKKIKFTMKEKCLVNLKINETSIIKKIEVKDEKINKQLFNLGFMPGEKIKLLNYNFNKQSYLVKVMNINYAIDKKICEGIVLCER